MSCGFDHNERELLCLKYIEDKISRQDYNVQLPHQRKSFASRVFHFHHNTIATRIFHFDLQSTVQTLVPGVLRFGRCAIKKVVATAVFDCRHFHSASMIFHLVHLNIVWLQPNGHLFAVGQDSNYTPYINLEQSVFCSQLTGLLVAFSLIVLMAPL